MTSPSTHYCSDAALREMIDSPDITEERKVAMRAELDKRQGNIRREFITSWVAQRQRSHHAATRGIVTPEERREWEQMAEERMQQLTRPIEPDQLRTAARHEIISRLGWESELDDGPRRITAFIAGAEFGAGLVLPGAFEHWQASTPAIETKPGAAMGTAIAEAEERRALRDEIDRLNALLAERLPSEEQIERAKRAFYAEFWMSTDAGEVDGRERHEKLDAAMRAAFAAAAITPQESAARELISAIAEELTPGRRDKDLVLAARELRKAAEAAPQEPSEADERITAWEAVAAHPALKPCYAEDRPLLPAVLDRLSLLADLEMTVNELAPAPQEPSSYPECEGCEEMGSDDERCPRHGLNHAGLWAEIDRLRALLAPTPEATPQEPDEELGRCASQAQELTPEQRERIFGKRPTPDRETRIANEIEYRVRTAVARFRQVEKRHGVDEALEAVNAEVRTGREAAATLAAPLVVDEAKLAEEKAAAWEDGVATALNHAKRGTDGISLCLVTFDGYAWPNPYRRGAGMVTDHEFRPVAGHPDDDECTHRADGTDLTYCGEPRDRHATPTPDPTAEPPACTCDSPISIWCPLHNPEPLRLKLRIASQWDADDRRQVWSAYVYALGTDAARRLAKVLISPGITNFAYADSYDEAVQTGRRMLSDITELLNGEELAH